MSFEKIEEICMFISVSWSISSTCVETRWSFSVSRERGKEFSDWSIYRDGVYLFCICHTIRRGKWYAFSSSKSPHGLFDEPSSLGLGLHFCNHFQGVFLRFVLWMKNLDKRLWSGWSALRNRTYLFYEYWFFCAKVLHFHRHTERNRTYTLTYRHNFVIYTRYFYRYHWCVHTL